MLNTRLAAKQASALACFKKKHHEIFTTTGSHKILSGQNHTSSRYYAPTLSL